MLKFVSGFSDSGKPSAILLCNLSFSYTMKWNGEQWVGSINGKERIFGKKSEVEKKLKKRAAKAMVAYLQQEGYIENLKQG